MLTFALLSLASVLAAPVGNLPGASSVDNVVTAVAGRSAGHIPHPTVPSLRPAPEAKAIFAGARANAIRVFEPPKP